MSDLIRREDVVEALYKAIRTNLRGTFTDSMSLAITMAKNIPSAEPEQTAKVRDIVHTHGYPDEGLCGNCNEDVNSLYNYCPYCGAKLDWSKNE